MNQVYVSAVVKSYTHTSTHTYTHLQHRTQSGRIGGETAVGECSGDVPLTQLRFDASCALRAGCREFSRRRQRRRRPSTVLPAALRPTFTNDAGPAARDLTRLGLVYKGSA